MSSILQPVTIGQHFRRRLRVYFYTSNLEKLLQARLLFTLVGERLNHFRANREPYDEDYSLPKRSLLENAIEQVRKQFLIRSIFFVEDTSIRIEALSDEEDFPGLRAKEWFSETSFSDLDQQLRRLGGHRSAIVKSDVALHLPNLERPFFFHGETRGEIALQAPKFSTSARYPWLTPYTFNGWIVPSGASVPLGAMTLEDSLHYDFRAKSIRSMLDFLLPLNAAANLPGQFFNIEREEPETDQTQLILPNLFIRPAQTPIQAIIIIGHKCAGKTTASSYIKQTFGGKFFEASAMLRRLAEDCEEEIDCSADAQSFLTNNGQDVVARHIVNEIDQDDREAVIVSGLRTIEEVYCITREFLNTKIVLIKTDRRIRFERHLNRGRDLHIKTERDFRNLDQDQLEFGVLTAAEEIADSIIINEGTLHSFQEKIHSEFVSLAGISDIRRPKSFSELSELHRCLLALRKLDSVSTCEAISDTTQHMGAKVWRYNTNRALKSVPLFASRHEGPDHPLSYGLTERGKILLSLLNLQNGVVEIG